MAKITANPLCHEDRNAGSCSRSPQLQSVSFSLTILVRETGVCADNNRTNEIGTRLALGAQPGQVRGMILRESTWLAVAGIVVGVAAALALTRLVKSMLDGIQPRDPLTLAGEVLILMVVALAASWIPARRAAGAQSMEMLRHE